MAHMVDPVSLKKAKQDNPDAVVLAYVNTTADVKALTDVCCTSANSLNIVKSLGDREILFVPDRNLAHYTKSMTGANITPWDGYCYVHNAFTVEDVDREKRHIPMQFSSLIPSALLMSSRARILWLPRAVWPNTSRVLPTPKQSGAA
jgi:quinolinate synthase